jgi:hypothetical protein
MHAYVLISMYAHQVYLCAHEYLYIHIYIHACVQVTKQKHMRARLLSLSSRTLRHMLSDSLRTWKCAWTRAYIHQVKSVKREVAYTQDTWLQASVRMGGVVLIYVCVCVVVVVVVVVVVRMGGVVLIYVCLCGV